jgi:hypothetical protein
VLAHSTCTFGKKPTLWDFMKDLPRNVNRKKQGF